MPPKAKPDTTTPAAEEPVETTDAATGTDTGPDPLTELVGHLHGFLENLLALVLGKHEGAQVEQAIRDRWHKFATAARAIVEPETGSSDDTPAE